jgi:hypothetical protein
MSPNTRTACASVVLATALALIGGTALTSSCAAGCFACMFGSPLVIALTGVSMLCAATLAREFVIEAAHETGGMVEVFPVEQNLCGDFVQVMYSDGTIMEEELA